MIDKIRMNEIVSIPLEAFESSSWRRKIMNDKSTLYFHRDRGISYYYMVRSQRLIIKGRLINLSRISNRVSNLDELCQVTTDIVVRQHFSTSGDGERIVQYQLESYSQDLNDVLEIVNAHLFDLFDLNIDVRTFRVTQIEVCFNVPTNNVPRYIEMFNLVFLKRKFKQYRNFTKEKNRPLHESFYVKSTKQFEQNGKVTYTINFYNKLNQLGKLLNGEIMAQYRLRDECLRKIQSGENITKSDRDRLDNPLPFTLEDMQRAAKALRLEVQCFSGFLGRNGKRYNIENSRTFSEFVNINTCRNIVVDRYSQLIGNPLCDFCSYEEAKSSINGSDLPSENKIFLLKYLLKYSHRHKISPAAWSKYRSMLTKLGIHWYLIPTDWGINRLVSPIKLLDDHIRQTEENRNNSAFRSEESRLVVDYSKGIIIEDDEIVDVADKIVSANHNDL